MKPKDLVAAFRESCLKNNTKLQMTVESSLPGRQAYLAYFPRIENWVCLALEVSAYDLEPALAELFGHSVEDVNTLEASHEFKLTLQPKRQKLLQRLLRKPKPVHVINIKTCRVLIQRTPFNLSPCTILFYWHPVAEDLFTAQEIEDWKPFTENAKNDMDVLRGVWGMLEILMFGRPVIPFRADYGVAE